MKTSMIVWLILLSVITLNAQDTTGLGRYESSRYSSFREYLAKNLRFDAVAFQNTGILMSGLVLSPEGKIVTVFSLNSLSPEIDKQVLDLFQASGNDWKPSPGAKKNEIIIVPVEFYLAGVENKIDTTNFKLPVYPRVMVTASLGGGPMDAGHYTATSKLLQRFRRYMSASKFDKAYPLIIELLKREPLNTEYYVEFMKLEKLRDDRDAVCQTSKFLHTYFRLDKAINAYLSGVDCN